MSTQAIKKVGFVGLGIMGSRMARNLARKGFEVTVWNRTRSRAEPLRAEGIKLAGTPAVLASEVDAFCSCLSDPPAIREVVFAKDGLLTGSKAGQLFIDFSTVSPEFSRELEAGATRQGLDFVEAPVTGSKTGAEKGTLLMMVGAKAQALERAQPVLQAVGEKVIHCGPVGAGSQVKLAGNALISMMRQVKKAAAERGRDPDQLISVMRCLVNRTDERLDDATRAVTHGTWDQIADDARKMADAGVDEIFFDVAFQKDAQSRDGLLRYMERFREMVGAGAAV